MSRGGQRALTAALSVALLAALVGVVLRERAERGRREQQQPRLVGVPAHSQGCVACHAEDDPGVVGPWRRSAHARDGIGCVDCHRAEERDADGYEHYDERIATVVTPRDCARCHPAEAEQFAGSRHAHAADWDPAEKVGMLRAALGRRGEPRAGADVDSPRRGESLRDEPLVVTGCARCHGSEVALVTTSGGRITAADLQPDGTGQPTRPDRVAEIARTAEGVVRLASGSWPNTGVGRRNLDGSLGSCGACHGRHDFAIHRARQPESCGTCHRGPDQPQLEVYQASKHAAALRAAQRRAGAAVTEGALGRDDVPAPTCATCHLSGHSRNGWTATHDPRHRLSWRLQEPLASRRRGAGGGAVAAGEGSGGSSRAAMGWQERRARMGEVCLHCHAAPTVEGYYSGYDQLVELLDEKFLAPGAVLVERSHDAGLLSRASMDEPLEWLWFDLWHLHGKRARLGAAMMSPNDVHARGWVRVARTFYGDFIPSVRELAASHGSSRDAQAAAVRAALEQLLQRPDHRGWRRAEPGARPPAAAGDGTAGSEPPAAAPASRRERGF